MAQAERAPSRWRKKPVEIEAFQFDGTDAGAQRVIDWINTFMPEDDGPGVWVEAFGSARELRIMTLEGVMEATEGDWIIRGVAGEFYPCKPAIFDASYDRAGDDRD